MKKRILIVAVVIAAIVVAVVALNRRQEKNPNEIHLAGNIEIDEVEVSFRVAGRMIERAVSEGGRVTAGQVVARLDDADLAHDIAQRRAELASADAQLAELRAGARSEEIAQAVAALEQARANAARAGSEYERSSELLRKDVISEREFEVAQNAQRSTRAAVTQAEQQLALMRRGARAEEVTRATANVERAKEGVAAAETRRDWTTAVAPISGVVLSESAQVGEQVTPGAPVLTLGNLDRIWMRAYVDETDLGRIRLGMPVRITTDSHPGKIYGGRITWIADEAEFTPKSVQTDKERVKLVYRIKVDVGNPNQELKPGMPADALIDVATR